LTGFSCIFNIMAQNRHYYIRRKWHGGLNRISLNGEWTRCPGLPREVQLVPTNACNLRCRACPKTHYPTDNRHLAPEVYERVKSELFPSVRVLNMQGLGEPMLSPLFEQMVSDARDYGLKIKFVTNATKFTPRIMKDLVECGADVTVSLDGARPDTHEDARPGSDFNAIMESLDQLLELRREIDSNDFHLYINTVVTRRNVSELEQILEIGVKYDISSLNLINPGVGEREDDYARDVIVHFPDLLREKIGKMSPRATSTGIALFYPDFAAPGKKEEGNHPPSLEKENPSLRGRLFPGKCPDPWRLTYIDVDGWVRPCCRAVWIGMGNILEKPFRQIWNDVHYRKLRETVNSNNPPDFCRSCTLFWGITRGNEFYMKELEEQGIQLPPPPEIGVTDPAKRETST